MSTVRTRWAAFGAAVAVTLGAGWFGLVAATSPSGASAFVPITPCRVMDTRPASNVGPKASPIGPGAIHTVITRSGNAGDCSRKIPTTATGVSLNLTPVGATAATYLTVWATNAGRPTASSVNPGPGQRPIPNAVITEISPAGQFNIYNRAGTVHLVADINGYYTDHRHDDRYYTKPQVDDAIGAGPFAIESESSTIGIEAGLLDEPDLANTLTVTAPARGQLLITASGNYSALLSQGLHPNVECSLTDDGSFDSSYRSQYEAWNDAPGGNQRSESDLAITRVIDVAAAGDITLDLLCHERSSGQRVLVVSRIVAQFIP